MNNILAKTTKIRFFPTVLSWFDPAVTLKWPHHDLGITPLWYQTATDVTMCTSVGFWQSYWKCLSNNLFSTVLSWFDLAMTLGWPYQDLGITPLWNPPPTHVTMCTWLDFRPSYMTHSYTTLRVKGAVLRWPLVTLSMHRKSADHLKVAWYIVRLKKIWFIKTPRGRGGEVSTFSPWSISAVLPLHNFPANTRRWHNVIFIWT